MTFLLLVLTSLATAFLFFFCQLKSFWTLVPLTWLLIISDQSVSLIIPVIMILAFPIFYAKYREKQKRQKLNQRLPHLLDTLSLNLRSGMALESSFQLATAQATGEIKEMSAEVLYRVSLGHSFEQALENEKAKWDSELFNHFTRIVMMSREAGLDMGKLFKKLAAEAREDLRLHEKTKAMSSQGTLQAWVLGLMPFILLGVLSILDPLRIESFFAQPQGKALLGVALILEAIGIFWIRKLIRP